MASLRTSIEAINPGISGDVSVLRDFFGFRRRRVPTDPVATERAEVRALQQIDAIQGRHLHINHICIGWLWEASDADRDTGLEKMDYAIYRTRRIYAPAGLGIGRVELWWINQDNADGFDDIGSRDECDELFERVTVDNNAMDCFVVRTVSASGFVGRAADIPGDDEKGGKDDGVLAGGIDRGGGFTLGWERFARTYAHEIGHYLGLEHGHGSGDDCENCPSTMAGRSRLMAQTRCAGTGCGGPGIREAVDLNDNDRSTARNGPLTRGGVSNVG